MARLVQPDHEHWPSIVIVSDGIQTGLCPDCARETIWDDAADGFVVILSQDEVEAIGGDSRSGRLYTEANLSLAEESALQAHRDALLAGMPEA